MKKNRKILNVFILAMINVAAICSIKNLPVNAEYGFHSLFFLSIAVLIFFMPVALVSAELATGWAETGGIFVWVKEAFGHKWGFLSIWYLWMTNIPWYPTLLSFIAGALAFIFNPSLANNKVYAFAMVIVLFWTATLFNLRGMKSSSWISTGGALLGTILPGVLIIILGLTWFLKGHAVEISFSWDSFFPNFTHLNEYVLMAGVLLSFAGIEMSAIHAKEVKHPQRDYPRAILFSAILIVCLMALGTLTIAMVIPQKEISLLSGSLDSFAFFLKAYHLSEWMPLMAILIAIGAYGQMSTWIAGPSRGLLIAAKEGDLPHFLEKVNKNNMPAPLLLLQAGIVTAVAFVFLFMPTVSSSFWLLLVITSQFYLLMYILMFLAAIKLRHSQPGVFRSYRVPGGKIGLWIVCSIGILSCSSAFLIGFIPPGQFDVGGLLFYETFLIGGVVLSTLVPFIILKYKGK